MRLRRRRIAYIARMYTLEQYQQDIFVLVHKRNASNIGPRQRSGYRSWLQIYRPRLDTRCRPFNFFFSFINYLLQTSVFSLSSYLILGIYIWSIPALRV